MILSQDVLLATVTSWDPKLRSVILNQVCVNADVVLPVDIAIAVRKIALVLKVAEVAKVSILQIKYENSGVFSPSLIFVNYFLLSYVTRYSFNRINNKNLISLR